MLKWNTVSDILRGCLIKLMDSAVLKNFRLVGGTALSLQIGHRMSVDIDLFTDADYGSVDFDQIENFLFENFEYVHGDFGGLAGMGKSYLIGNSVNDSIKLDIYYAMDPFFQDILFEDGIRMATTEEIIAMKTDIIQRNGRKKDFWDLHELLECYPIARMIELHRQRFEWTHKTDILEEKFTDFDFANNDLNPICLKDKEWVFIKEDFIEAIETYKLNKTQ